nr:hypothetical protein [Chloroflexota bacterium]
KASQTLAAKGVKIALVDTPYDWVNHPEIGATGVEEYHNPRYHRSHHYYGGQVPPVPKDQFPDETRVHMGKVYPYKQWHTWTSTHAAEETRQFMEKYWD